MKSRFGDQNLHGCEVMIKDIKDSERIRAAVKKAIHEKGGRVATGSKALPLSNFNVCIVSQGFWEQVQD